MVKKTTATHTRLLFEVARLVWPAHATKKRGTVAMEKDY